MHLCKGSASIELMAMAPLIALFIIIALQLASVFSHAVLNVADADAMAARALRAWDESHDGKGLERPCIEKNEDNVFRSSDDKIAIGVGSFSHDVSTQQEVRIAVLPICVP